MNKKCALLGFPLYGSRSESVHNAYFEQEGIPAAYQRHALRQEELGPFLEKIRGNSGWAGLSVTMPHKQSVKAHLDAMDPSAEAAQAVNTICVETGGKLVGYNTDGWGALKAFEERQKIHSELHLGSNSGHFSVPLGSMLEESEKNSNQLKGSCSGKQMLVIGAGGAAQAIASEAARRGLEVIIANRTLARAQQIADRIGGSALALDALEKEAAAALREDAWVVQATPVGMLLGDEGTRSAHIDDPSWLRPGHCVLECVTNPPWTPFMLKAKAIGCELILGREMWIYQALAQYRLWFPGHRADANRLRALFNHAYGLS